MSFLEDIKGIEKERQEKENEIINEIVEYFNTRINSEKYEEYLKKRIVEKINESKNTLTLYMKFWRYRDGCSGTNFSCGGYTWYLEKQENQVDKYRYKGINLGDIHNEICKKIHTILLMKLESLGLEIIKDNKVESRFNDYNREIEVRW